MEYYFAVFRPAVEGGYSVAFPDIPEAFTEGETVAECMENAAEVLAIAAEEAAKSRRSLPSPSGIEDIARWIEDHTSDPGLAPGEIITPLLSVPDMDLTPVKINISLPKSLLQRIDHAARQKGMTRSGFLAQAAQAYGV